MLATEPIKRGLLCFPEGTHEEMRGRASSLVLQETAEHLEGMQVGEAGVRHQALREGLQARFLLIGCTELAFVDEVVSLSPGPFASLGHKHFSLNSGIWNGSWVRNRPKKMVIEVAALLWRGLASMLLEGGKECPSDDSSFCY